MRIVPAAALRGFAAGAIPAATRSSFIFSKAFCGSTTSPRTSNCCGSFAAFNFAALTCSGMLRIVRTFVVTSSPMLPSPRVTPDFNTAAPPLPGSYCKASDKPSSFNSQT